MLQGWLVDEWEGVQPNRTVVLNATLCGVFPAQFCPSGAPAAHQAACCAAARGAAVAGSVAVFKRSSTAAQPPHAPPACPFEHHHPVAVDADAAYGLQSLGERGQCTLARYLNPTACILPLPLPIVGELGRWERTSANLTVNADAKQSFEGALVAAWGGAWRGRGVGRCMGQAQHDAPATLRRHASGLPPASTRPPPAFLPYLERTAQQVNDSSLLQEADLLRTLIAAPSP